MNVALNRSEFVRDPEPMTCPFDGWVEFEFDEGPHPARLALARPIPTLEFTEEDINDALDCLDSL